ncbi:MAG: ABC transporter ATP-binding protein [Candidatus Limiplasma sp.]|nr:ABC transporter ATP-binding protein [Clostridiales bacterium]MDY4063419.1 ABC transporter ATP-binding protein [Candidatus Limiplasma sp.]
MSTPKIEFRNVTKIFQTRSQQIIAVKDYSMQVESGDFVSIIGPSGCGKSTLIRMLDGIIQPTGGEILIDGNPLDTSKKLPKEILRKMGFIFQNPNMLPWYTLRQNVALPNRIIGNTTCESEEYVDFLMNMAGLSECKDAYPVEVSGGALQRAGVIRAMVHKPEILLMDEPFGALDEMMREQLDMELLSIWKKMNTTVIFITHNVEEAVLLSSSIYVMGTQPGRLLQKVAIDLPRPRELSMITTPRFVAYERELTELIGKLELKNIK